MNATTTLRPLTPSRNPLNGRFVPSDHAAAVQMVSLPGGKVGWRVGGGRIYADKASALRHGLHRAARVVLVNQQIEAAFERSVELGWN